MSSKLAQPSPVTQKSELRFAPTVSKFDILGFHGRILTNVGDAERPDNLVITRFHDQVFGVLDGVSSPSVAEKGPQLINGKTDGQFFVDEVREFFADGGRSVDIRAELVVANDRVGAVLRRNGVDVDYSNPSLLSGCSGALLRIDQAGHVAQIISWGDSFVFCELESGEYLVTKNKLTEGGVRSGLLNGQPEFESVLEERIVPLDKLVRVLICTSGLLGRDRAGDSSRLEEVPREHELRGLVELYKARRAEECEASSGGPASFAEVSAIDLFKIPLGGGLGGAFEELGGVGIPLDERSEEGGDEVDGDGETGGVDTE